MGMIIQQDNFRPDQLERFKHFQRTSYDVLVNATDILKPGISEQQAASHIRKQFHLAGARWLDDDLLHTRRWAARKTAT